MNIIIEKQTYSNNSKITIFFNYLSVTVASIVHSLTRWSNIKNFLKKSKYDKFVLSAFF